MTKAHSEEIEANMWFLSVGDRPTDARNKPLDGNPKLIMIDRSVSEPKWFYQARNSLRYGVPVEAHHIMTRFRWHGAPPSDIHRWNAWLFVSESFKTVVERLEPGRHQFFPIDIVGTHKVIIGSMFVLVPNVAVRCFSKLSSGYHPIGWEEHWGDHIWHVEGSCRDPRLIFEDAKVEGHHLWVAIDQWDRPIMVSNTLRKALLEAELTNLRFSPAESRERMRWALPEIIKSSFTVDPPWKTWLADE